MLKLYNALFFLAVMITAVWLSCGQTAKTTTESKLFDAAQLIRDIQTLSSDEMEGRSANRPSMEKARDFIDRRFKESGLEPFGLTFRQEFEIKRRGTADSLKGVNFIGLIKGKKQADKYIVITAHYDHLGIRDGKVFNGADDNASGTSALFAIASHFKNNRPEHSLIFAAFDAEEKGLDGARNFVTNPPVPKESILLNVNMDMISRNDKNELYAAGAFHSPKLRPLLEKAQKAAKVKLLLGHDDPKLGMGDWTNQSDHAAFHAAQIPFIYFGVEDHKDYHKSTDDFANIQPEFFVRAVETIIESVQGFDKFLLQHGEK